MYYLCFVYVETNGWEVYKTAVGIIMSRESCSYMGHGCV